MANPSDRNPFTLPFLIDPMATKILVVEDHWDSRAILKMLLQNLWDTAIEAKNGHEGLGKAAAELPDLIIMDIGLPGMDGIETTLKQRQNPATAGISVDAYTIWKERAQQAGIVEYPTKPTPQPVFKDVIEWALEVRC
ncbi:MAG: response regulator [Candidatus Binatia bacterium]|nr:response regulator [Candidatus Binatia bacterium]